MDLISPPARMTRLRHGGHREASFYLAARGRQIKGLSLEPIPGLSGSYPNSPPAELDKSNLLTLLDLRASVVNLDSDGPISNLKVQ